MIFPCFKSFAVNSPIGDQVCFPPQGDHLFLRHVRLDIRDMTRAARGENENKNSKKKQTKDLLSSHGAFSPFFLFVSSQIFIRLRRRYTILTINVSCFAGFPHGVTIQSYYNPLIHFTHWLNRIRFAASVFILYKICSLVFVCFSLSPFRCNCCPVSRPCCEITFFASKPFQRQKGSMKFQWLLEQR